jgi:hypothetical protein
MSIHCYRHTGTEILDTTTVDSPCGNLNSTDPIVQCCGHGNFCLTEGLCSYQHSLVGGSGYYIGACTDSSGLCPGFPNRCTSQSLPDATWNSTFGLCQCCGADSYGNPSCDNPQNDQFIAPAPSLLQTIFSVPLHGWAATSTSIRATDSIMSTSVSSVTTISVSGSISEQTAPTSAVSSNSDISQNDLSIGAKAGIGVGAALAGLAAVGLLIYLVYRQRGHRSHSGDAADPAAGYERAQIHEMYDLQEKVVEGPVMVDKGQRPADMSVRDPIHELQARE